MAESNTDTMREVLQLPGMKLPAGVLVGSTERSNEFYKILLYRDHDTDKLILAEKRDRVNARISTLFDFMYELREKMLKDPEEFWKAVADNYNAALEEDSNLAADTVGAKMSGADARELGQAFTGFRRAFAKAVQATD
jgi:hypothetical protein